MMETLPVQEWIVFEDESRISLSCEAIASLTKVISCISSCYSKEQESGKTEELQFSVDEKIRASEKDTNEVEIDRMSELSTASESLSDRSGKLKETARLTKGESYRRSREIVSQTPPKHSPHLSRLKKKTHLKSSMKKLNSSRQLDKLNKHVSFRHIEEVD